MCVCFGEQRGSRNPLLHGVPRRQVPWRCCGASRLAARVTLPCPPLPSAAAPLATVVTPSPLKVTVSWQAPAVNPDPLGIVSATAYSLEIWNAAVLIDTKPLTGAGGGGSVSSPYVLDVPVPAGTGARRAAAAWATERMSARDRRDPHACCDSEHFTPFGPAGSYTFRVVASNMHGSSAAPLTGSLTVGTSALP